MNLWPRNWRQRLRGRRATSSRYRQTALDLPARLLAAALRCMPVQYHDWGIAMQAELAQISQPLERWRFAAGCRSRAPAGRTGIRRL